MKEAKYYQRTEDGKIVCKLCPQYCLIAKQEIGKCRARKNIEGKLYALNYGKTVSLQLDPIEKKPLFHFYPGKSILSIGANSCNLTCQYCQNYSISQYKVPTYDVTKEQLLEICEKQNCEMLAFTYTEPTTWYEFMLDSAKFLTSKGIKIVCVTNGYINEEPLLELLPYLDAMNIDLKSMRDEFYDKTCGGSVKPVLKTIEIAAQHTHLEITNLVIPGYNDSPAEVDELIDFIAGINPDIPLHFSKYYPAFQFSAPPTSEKTLIEIYHRAKAKLNYVYLGNMIFANSTKCPHCNTVLLNRDGNSSPKIRNNSCPECGTQIYGKWDS